MDISEISKRTRLKERYISQVLNGSIKNASKQTKNSIESVLQDDRVLKTYKELYNTNFSRIKELISEKDETSIIIKELKVRLCNEVVSKNRYIFLSLFFFTLLAGIVIQSIRSGIWIG